MAFNRIKSAFEAVGGGLKLTELHSFVEQRKSGLIETTSSIEIIVWPSTICELLSN